MYKYCIPGFKAATGCKLNDVLWAMPVGF